MSPLSSLSPGFELVARYSLQAAVLAWVGLATARLLRLRDPQSQAAHWQWTLAFTLLAPLVGLAFPSATALGGLNLAADAAVGAAIAASPTVVQASALQVLLLGTAAMLGWRIAGLLRLHLYRRRSAPFPAGSALAHEAVRAQASVGAHADCRICDGIAGPLTFGVGKPVIRLPPSLLNMPAPGQRAVLAHELLHVRRRDWVRLLGLEALRCLFWFHPLIRILLSKLNAVRELLVDRRAIELTADPRSYLEALLETARGSSRRQALTAPLFLERGALKNRIQHILEDRPMSLSQRIARAGAIVSALILFACLAQLAIPLRRSASARRPMTT